MGDTGALLEKAETPGHLGPAETASRRCTEDQADVLPQRPGDQPSLEPPPPMSSQRLEAHLGKRDRPPARP
jgi:hypothetical protein